MPVRKPLRRARPGLVAIVMALLLAALAACGGTDTPTPPPTTEAAAIPPAASSAATAPPDTPVPPTAAANAPGQPAPNTPAPTAVTESPAIRAAAAQPPPLTPDGATPTAALGEDGLPLPLVDADPDFQNELDRNGFHRGLWHTDFSRYTIDFSEVFSGGVPRDGIPPLDTPRFEGVAPADAWLDDIQPVVFFEHRGEAKAYPLAILTWHEIVNDTVGGAPVAITFCPLCNSAIAFDRRLAGTVFDFGVSGLLRNSDLIMWDRQTESWWQQLTGAGIVGRMAGYQLDLLPAAIIAWGDFKRLYPDSAVLSRDTGHRRDYGRNPYGGYDRADEPPFLFQGELDGRLLPKERVAAVTLDGQSIAFPFTALERERAVNYRLGDTAIAVFFAPGAVSALDRSNIAASRDVGAVGVFQSILNGRTLTFAPAVADGATAANGAAALRDGEFTDAETGTTWNILGQATAGPLAGQRLTPVVHGAHFWFAWAAFRPETTIWR